MSKKSTTNKFLLTIIFGIGVWGAAGNLLASGTDTLWTKTYGGSDDDHGRSVQQTTDKGYIITGDTKSYGGGGMAVYLIKTDSLGDTLWTKVYGGIYDDAGRCVQQTTDGGYIITGWTKSYGASPGTSDVWLIKTDSMGDTLWTKTYGGLSVEYGEFVQQTTDRGYIITGGTASYGPGSPDSLNLYLIKTDSLGDTLWTKTYGGNYTDFGWCVQQTTDRGYIITGYKGKEYYSSWIYTDVWLIKTDSMGDTLWTKTYGGFYNDVGYRVQETADRGYIIVGSNESYSSGDNSDIWALKTDSLGNLIWAKIYGGPYNDYGYSVQQLKDEGYIIIGSKEFYIGASLYHFDVYIVRTDTLGDTLWTRAYGDNASNRWGNSGQQTADGEYIIAGNYRGLTGYKDDVYLLKLGAEGGIEAPISITTNRFFITQIYPNPFIGNTKIKYVLPEDSWVNITIYNQLGRKVITLINGNKGAGYHTLKWQGIDNRGRKLPSGFYFVKVSAGKYTQTKKICLIKL